MKKLLLLFLATLLLTELIGQSLELANVTKQGFKGLRSMGKDGYYIQYIEGQKGAGKNAKVFLHLYAVDNELKSTSDFVVELKPSEAVEDLAFNGGNFMIIYSSRQKKTRTFKMMDAKGTEIKKKEIEDVNPRLLTKPAAIIPVGGSDFLVINYIKEKKVGYSVERYSKEMEQVYSQERIPDKKKLYPVDYAVSGNNLYVLEFLDADMNDTFEYSVAVYNLETGTPGKTSVLVSADSKAYGFATFIKPLKDGGAATGGMYFNGPRTQEANSDGFFAARVSPEGDLKFSYVDWKDVDDKLKDKSTAAFWGGKTKTFIHDLWIRPDGGVTIIGENFRRGDADLAGGKSKSALGIAGKIGSVSSGADSDIAVTAAEFAIMEFDASGTFTGVHLIDKPNAITIIKNSEDPDDKPFVGQKKGLNLANILNNYGYLPYRFVADGPRPYLVYWQRYDPIVKELVYFTPLDATKMDTVSIEVTGSELKLQQELQNKILGSMGVFGKLAKKGGEVGGGSYENTFELRGSHDPFDYRAKKLNTRIVPSNVPGKIAIYDFLPQVDEKEKKSFTARMMDTANGILKVWYITIPTQ